jgi:tRNA(Ile)-lysidine synthase
MLSELEKKAGDYIKSNELFQSGDKVLLAVSGGADSMALLYILRALKAEKVIDSELFCAHVNHQLRGSDADSDEDFVIARAAKLGLTVTTKQVDVRGFAESNKISIETAARQLRIEILTDIACANGCKLIATAHQKNDNVETILQRLSRGTGFRGLAGIWPMRTFGEGFRFVRPLLCAGRDEIIDYLTKRNLEWRTDHTNADCTFRRNYIRHRLLPVLQKDCKVSLVDQLSGLSESARGFYKKVCGCADKIWPTVVHHNAEEKIILDIKIFQVQPQPVKVELIRRCLDSIGCGQRNLTQEHFERILHLAKQNVTGIKIELPGGFVARREYGDLIFSNCRVGLAPPSLHSVILQVPGQTKFDKFLIEATVLEKKKIDFEKFKAAKTGLVEWFDLDKTKSPLVVRFRQAGDKFVPLGIDGQKKVGKFLTAARVPHDVRQKILIVADEEKIIWLCPVRISEQVKVTANTKTILQLNVTEAGK